MKPSESFNEMDYLNKLFTAAQDETAEAESNFLLVDTPENLSEELYAITEADIKTQKTEHALSGLWPKFAAIAASLVMAVVLLQSYNQQQTIKQLEQAQHDLAIALHYLSEANKITQAQMINTLNSNMQKATIVPVLEVGRGLVIPSNKTTDSAAQKPNRTL